MKILKEIAYDNGITSLHLDQEQTNMVKEVLGPNILSRAWIWVMSSIIEE
ncbi:hypothetical protein Scep_010058 [Stephania cephalantha]|uniref:Uncharacterized protein n=1 Tax=Stephania cephalantha TaxID=152367 RepID=A0AAP0PDQ7_9MAGN